MTTSNRQEATMTPLTQWLRTGEVARILGISPTRVVQLANQGRIHHHHLPGGRLFDPADVARFERERATP